MNDKLRPTGIPVIGDVPWGTHFCQFYRTPQDLLDVLVPYFSKGLENNELCVWVTSERLGVEAARAALLAALPDLEGYVRRRQIEIVPHAALYLEDGTFDVGRVLEGFRRKLGEALAAGFEGLRVAGDGSWLETKDWQAFTDYEAAVDKIVASSRALAACAYSLDRCGLDEILDIIRNHRFALVRREGRWETVESGERKRLMEEIDERARTEASLRLEEARLDALLTLSQMGEAPLNEITNFILEQAIRLTRSKIGFVGFLNEDESVYTLHAVSKDVVRECAVTGDPLQWHVGGAGIWADAIREHRTLFMNDYSRPLPRKKGLPAGHPPIERFMVVPIVERGRIVAVAGVGNKAADYNVSDERQVSLLLSGMGSCLRRQEAREELRKAYGELEEKVKLRTAELSASNAALERSGRRIAEILASIQDGFFTLDRDWRFTYINERAAANVGLKPAELIGKNLWETFPGIVATPHERHFRRAMDERRIEKFSIEGVLTDQWYGITVYPAEEGISVYWQDVTEARKSEALRQALAEQERLRLGAAVEQASDAVVMLDLDGTIRYVNAAFETINRVPRERAVGSSYFDFLGEGPAAAPVREALAEGRSWHGELSRPVADGRPVELQVTVSPATDARGKIIGGLVTEKDVTQESALQRLVRQSQKMEALGTLAGGITHDFNNILGTIVVNTELALLDLEPSHPARAPLPAVLQAANRGKQLVKQIITFSRQREWDKRPLEVAPVIKEGMRLLRSTLPKDLVIHETISAESGSILGDPSQVHQILVNLCQNAALAMREKGGHLEVKLEPVEVDAGMVARHPDLEPGPHVRLTVADTGCGMSREVMERIFEPFFTTRGLGEGSGLGLAVVHGIVRSYRGSVTVYSESGKGSVFSIYLPRLDGSAARDQAEVPARPERGRERILLVEDEPAQRRSLARSLQKLGYRVTSRGEGRSALTAFRKAPDSFDVVVTDQTMPRMSGLELAAAVTKLRPETPVVLCTGFSEKVNGTNGVNVAHREFIMKPFTLDEISRVIRKALGKDGGGE